MRETRKEIRMCKDLGVKETVGKWSFKKIDGEKVFIGVNLEKEGDFIQLKKHSVVTKDQLKKEAPLRKQKR